MNILPKKSWHVRNKDNIERVRKDEAKAAEEEKDRLRRIALAEQEARTALLRKRAKDRGRNDSNEYESNQQVAEVKPHQHINFFSEYEADKQRTGTNKEYEDEKKDEKEKYEKSIGLLTYLGQNSVESQVEKPWYFKPPQKKKRKTDEDDEDDSRTEADQKRKHGLDPMIKMTEYLDKKKKKDNKHDKEKHHSKHKKHKHKHKSKDKSKDPHVPSSTTSIEQLRAERLKREQEERLKTERLMAKMRGEKIPGDKEPVVDDRHRKYNSQFNPEFVRKPKEKKTYY